MAEENPKDESAPAPPSALQKIGPSATSRPKHRKEMQLRGKTPPGPIGEQRRNVAVASGSGSSCQGNAATTWDDTLPNDREILIQAWRRKKRRARSQIKSFKDGTNAGAPTVNAGTGYANNHPGELQSRQENRIQVHLHHPPPHETIGEAVELLSKFKDTSHILSFVIFCLTFRL
jgi:hypothetical protein